MRWALRIIILAIVALAAASLLVSREDDTINVVGSTSVQPFAEKLAQSFHHDEFVVDVQGGGSTQGVLAVRENVAELGMVSRRLKVDEAEQFDGIEIAYDGMAIVVHRDNPAEGLTRSQLRDIFRGHVTDWSQLGGQAGPIRLITREEGSGTREAFVTLVMAAPEAGGLPTARDNRISRRALTQESNGAVMEVVRGDRMAIGYTSLGLVGDDMKILSVDGQYPHADAVVDGRYPLVRPFMFVVKSPRPAGAEAFIEFVLSDEGQAMLEEEGLVRVR